MQNNRYDKIIKSALLFPMVVVYLCGCGSSRCYNWQTLYNLKAENSNTEDVSLLILDEISLESRFWAMNLELLAIDCKDCEQFVNENNYIRAYCETEKTGKKCPYSKEIYKCLLSNTETGKNKPNPPCYLYKRNYYVLGCHNLSTSFVGNQFIIEPGQHTLVIRMANRGGEKSGVGTVKLNAEPGKVYLLRAYVEPHILKSDEGNLRILDITDRLSEFKIRLFSNHYDIVDLKDHIAFLKELYKLMIKNIKSHQTNPLPSNSVEIQ